MINWKTIIINTKETFWEISKNGDIRSVKTGRLKSPKINTKTGYVSHCFQISNKKYYKYLHRLVAENFLTDFNEDKTINHKDGDKLNNHFDNLECVTIKDNIRHGFKTGLFDKNLSPVLQYDLEGNLLKEFKNITEASLETGSSISSISACAKLKYQHNRAFQWRYLGDIPPTDISNTTTNRGLKVSQKDKEGNVLNVFPSLKEAYLFLEVKDNGYLSRVCKKKNKYYNGFYWEIHK